MPNPEVKQYLFQTGIFRTKEFLHFNSLRIPEIVDRPLNSTGLCEPRQSRLSVYVKETAWPVIKPCHMRWSHPGWKTDRTAYGVVAHEAGHWIEYLLRGKRQWDQGAWILAVKSNPRKITSYEPNLHEAFAETMRVFIGNPDLLRLGIPERHHFVTKYCGLATPETRDYKTVLGNENFFPAADKWCAQ